MSGDADGMRDAEAADPGFVYRNGWTHLKCEDCREVIYDGRRIGPEDTAAIIRAHEIACEGRP